MPTMPEYAQLANSVYGRTRTNQIPIPTGWIEERPLDQRLSLYWLLRRCLQKWQ